MLNGLVVYHSIQPPLNGMNRSLVYAAPFMREAGIDLHFVTARHPWHIVQQLLHIRRRMRTSQFDFVLFNSTASLAPKLNPWGMRFAKLFRRTRIPFFVYWHETNDGFERSQRFGLDVGQVTRLLDDSAVTHLAASKSCSQDAEQRFPHAKHFVIYECAAAPSNAALAMPVEPPIVIGVGGIQAHKGIDLFVQTAILVCAEHPTVRFVWAGGGVAFGKWQEEVSNSAVKDRVLLMGHVENPSGLIGMASVFFAPSRDDTFPLSVLEAMSHGRSVVAFQVGGIPEQVQGMGRLIPRFDTQQAANAILEILSRPAEERIVPTLRERYLEHFAPEPFAKRLAQVIRTHINQN